MNGNKQKNRRFLDGVWNLYIAENKDCAAQADALCTEDALKETGFLRIDGRVPGNFELDMQEAGLLPDMYFGEDTLLAQTLENRHLWYVTRFSSEGEASRITFEGIDTVADIYLNGEKIGDVDNMLIEHVLTIAPRVGMNELVVHIKPTCIEARKNVFEAGIRTFLPYNAPAVTVRKAAHTFGWDIMPRIVSGGIWKSVYVEPIRKNVIEDIYLTTERVNGERAQLYLYYRVNIEDDFATKYRLVIRGKCGESEFSFEKKLFHTEGVGNIRVENPVLWWPRGMGEAKLYDVTVELYYGDECTDRRELSVGIRSVRLINSEYIDDDGNGEFYFLVNGEKMYARGTNWVPLDAFHSRDLERLPMALDLLWDSNCNMVRMWGGNVYESDAFYDYCDRHGIAVWQDFSMACSYYPQTEDFCKKLDIEARAVVRRLRNRPSLFLWAGDNECDFCRVGWGGGKDHVADPKDNYLTRHVLPEVIRATDPFRTYLPSSPYISERTFARGEFNRIPEHHLWGPRGYYKADFYTKAEARFVSETGYHGCPSVESIRKFIPEEKLWHWKNNRAWLTHACCMEPEEGKEYSYRIALMDSQITHAFGVTAQTLEEFSRLSQITQAEADKFFIERNRLGKWEYGSGIFFWNLIDGFPQFSDAVVDYYGGKKLAYHAIKRVFEPIVLMCREPEDGQIVLVASNDTLVAEEITYHVTDVTHDVPVCQGRATLASNANTVLASFGCDERTTTMYLISWEMGGKRYQNHYLCGKAPLDPHIADEGYRKIGL